MLSQLNEAKDVDIDFNDKIDCYTGVICHILYITKQISSDSFDSVKEIFAIIEGYFNLSLSYHLCKVSML